MKSDIHAKDRISIGTTQEILSMEKTDFLYDVGMEINDWITAARKDARLTQDQLAEALGVTRGNVSAWENGRHEPSLSQLRKIGVLCRADLAPLFGGTSIAMPKTVREAEGWPFKVAYPLYATLPDEEKIRLDDYVTFAVERWHSYAVKSKKAS